MSIGLVLAGGGGKGAYQIGVWKAFIELGIDKKINAVAGTSIGALNTALFLNGDFNKAYDIWCNISNEKILVFNGKNLKVGDIDLEITFNDISYLMQQINSSNMLASKKSLIWPNITKGIFSREGLLDIINSNLKLSNISNSKILGFVTCTLMPWIIPKYFLLNNQTDEFLQSVLLASSAFPIAFGFEKINKYYYIDGGLADNIPITPLYIHGYENIIVIHLSTDYKINKSMYPYTNIIEIKPTKDLGNLITGTFDFDKTNAIARIEQGYNDTINLKDQLLEIGN